MNYKMKKVLVSVAATGLLLATSLNSVSAASALIEAAKNECVVGEQANGYLGVVSGASASESLKRDVSDTNQRRKAVYADLAKRNGVTIEVTAALTAEKLMSQASRGQCIRDGAGKWVKL